MVDVFATVSSVVALLGTAIALIQQVQKAQDAIKGTSETLENITNQLNTLDTTLNLIKDQERLQTANVGQQVRATIEVTEDLRDLFDKIKSEQQRKAITQFFHALKSGDKDDKELAKIFDRLDRARLDLVLRISLAQVGLIGNLQDGFRVAFGVLQETNQNVKQVLGRDLDLAIRVKDMQPLQADGTVALEQADVKALGLNAAPDTAPDDAAAANSDTTTIVDNITIGQARIMTGDIGVETWRKKVTRKVTIKGNMFGSDIRITTGNMGGQAAANFNENFWK